MLRDGRQKRHVLRGLGLAPAAVFEAAAAALAPADGFVVRWIPGAHAAVLAEGFEDFVFALVLHRDDLAGSRVDLEAERRLADEALEEEAVDLQLERDREVAPRADVARELGVADDVAAAGGIADEEVGLADELAGFAVEGELEAKARLVDRGGVGADGFEGEALAGGLVVGVGVEVDDCGQSREVGGFVKVAEVAEELVEGAVGLLLGFLAGAQGDAALAFGRAVVVVDVGGFEAQAVLSPVPKSDMHGWTDGVRVGRYGRPRRYTSPRCPIRRTR